MDTSNSDLNVKVYDLKSSLHPEDQETVKNYEQALKMIIEEIKPILRYICTVVYFNNLLNGVRCFEVGNFEAYYGNKFTLFLAENGKFFATREVKEAKNKLQIVDMGNIMQGLGYECIPKDIVTQGDNLTWIHMPFSELIANIKAVLDQAEQKRREHLETLEKRSRLLGKILETIKTQEA